MTETFFALNRCYHSHNGRDSEKPAVLHYFIVAQVLLPDSSLVIFRPVELAAKGRNADTCHPQIYQNQFAYDQGRTK